MAPLAGQDGHMQRFDNSHTRAIILAAQWFMGYGMIKGGLYGERNPYYKALSCGYETHG